MLLLAACGGDSSATIVEIQQTNNPLVVDVIIDTCNADVSVDVEESGSEVEFDVHRSDSASALGGTDDCLDMVRVALDEPLGSRQPSRADGTSIPFVAISGDEP